MVGLHLADLFSRQHESTARNEALRKLAKTIAYSGVGFYQGLQFPMQSIASMGFSETILDEGKNPVFDGSITSIPYDRHTVSGRPTIPYENDACRSALLVPLGELYTTTDEVEQFMRVHFNLPDDSQIGKNAYVIRHNMSSGSQEFFLMFYGLEEGGRLTPVVLYGLSTDSNFSEKFCKLLKNCKGHGTRQVLTDLLESLYPQVPQILVGQILHGKGLPEIKEVIEHQKSQSLTSYIPTREMLVDGHLRESILAPTENDVLRYLYSSEIKSNDAATAQKSLCEQIEKVKIPQQMSRDGSIQAKAKEKYYRDLVSLASDIPHSARSNLIDSIAPELKKVRDDMSFSVFRYNRETEEHSSDVAFSTVSIHKKINRRWSTIWDNVKTKIEQDTSIVVNLLNIFLVSR